jgi:hypothetical protein
MIEWFHADVMPSEHVTAIAYSAAARDRAGISSILAHGAGANHTSSSRTRGASRRFADARTLIAEIR